jgi:hypothetical protein
MTRGPKFGGCAQSLPIFGFLKLYCMILFDFKPVFGSFCPLLEDLEPFLRPDLGRKLGGCYQLQIFINQRFLAAWRGSEKEKC